MTADRTGMIRFWGNMAAVAAPVLLASALFLPVARDLAPLDRWAVSFVAVALLVLGFAMRRGTAAFGVLAFALVAGTGAQLYLTEPVMHPVLRLRPQDWRDVVMLLVLVGEMVVAGAFLRRSTTILSDLFNRFGVLRIAVFLCLTFTFAVPVSDQAARDIHGAYSVHMLAAAAFMGVHMVTLLAMAGVKSPVSGTHRVSPALHATVAFLSSLALTVLVFDAMPHSEAEVAYLFQARTLAGGALSVPSPGGAAIPGLDYPGLEISDEAWYSRTLPGWPAALAVAGVLGLPWLLNPLLAGTAVFLAHAIAKAKAGRDAADIVALLMAFSPWYLAAAGTLMPLMLVLVLTLFAWWQILQVEAGASGRHWRLTMAGLVIGWIILARPAGGVVIGGLTGMWLLFAVRRGTMVSRAFPYVLGCLAGVGLLLVFNAQIDVWPSGPNADHGQAGMLARTVNLVAILQSEFLGWPVGSLALVFAFLVWHARTTGFDQAMVAYAAIVICVAVLWPSSSTGDFGPFFGFAALFPITYLSARGCEALQDRLSDVGGQAATRLDTVIWLLCVIGLCVFLPWRSVGTFHEYGGFHPEFRSAADTGIFENAVVMFEADGNDGSALMLNDPWLPLNAPIFLRKSGALSEGDLQGAFPGRAIVEFTPGWRPGDPAGRD